jgi:hypothetical protein
MAQSLEGARGAKNAHVSVAASQTDSVVVAAVAGQKIRVLQFLINQGDTTPSTVTFNTKPAGAGSAIFPVLKAAANGGFVVPFGKHGWFETGRGEGLTVTTGAGSTTSIVVVYEMVY